MARLFEGFRGVLAIATHGYYGPDGSLSLGGHGHTRDLAKQIGNFIPEHMDRYLATTTERRYVMDTATIFADFFQTPINVLKPLERVGDSSWTPEAELAVIDSLSGAELDPDLIDALLIITTPRMAGWLSSRIHTKHVAAREGLSNSMAYVTLEDGSVHLVSSNGSRRME